MIVTISGTPGSGKSTLAKKLAKALGFKHHSAGELWRSLAKEKGLSPLELNKLAEKHEKFDAIIDSKTRELGQTQDNFVMDSRLAWYFIPKSVKIFVKTDLRVASQRIFKDMRSDEKENTSIKKTLEQLRERMESERKRYKRLYGVDYLDEKNYDLVIDNTQNSIDETLAKAMGFVKQYIKKE